MPVWDVIRAMVIGLFEDAAPDGLEVRSTTEAVAIAADKVTVATFCTALRM